MSTKRKVLLVVFIVSGIVSMWVRVQYDKRQKMKRENLYRSLTSYDHPSATPTLRPEDLVQDGRSMYDSTLPQESMELITQAIGSGFRLKQLTIAESAVTAEISADEKKVKIYRRFKNHKFVEPPQDALLIGDARLGDILFSSADVDLSLIPKLVKTAREKAELQDAKITMIAVGFSIGLRSSEPEWYVLVGGTKDGKSEDRSVIFELNGKFKRVLG